MLIPLAYPIVKRIPFFRDRITPYVSLQTLAMIHVYAGILGPVFEIIHTGHKFDGFLGISLTAVMLLVVVSGYAARYLNTFLTHNITDKLLMLQTARGDLDSAWRVVERSPAQLRVLPGAPELTAGLASFGIMVPVGGPTGDVIRIAEGVADLEFSIRTHEMFERWFSRALKLHIYLSIYTALFAARATHRFEYSLRTQVAAMKTWMPWLGLILLVGTTWFVIDPWKPAAAMLRHSGSPGPLSSAHAFLSNRCESCHEANVGVTVTKCVVCHANDERLLGRHPSAFHANIGECSSCHIEHLGTNRSPVIMDHVALARIGIKTLERTSSTDAGSANTVASLKTWLQVKNFAHMDEHSAGEALNCIGCHSTKDKHLGLFGKEFAQCHTMIKWTIASYQHPSPRSTQCAQCHQAPPSHYMMHFDMISKSIAGQEDTKVADASHYSGRVRNVALVGLATWGGGEVRRRRFRSESLTLLCLLLAWLGEVSAHTIAGSVLLMVCLRRH